MSEHTPIPWTYYADSDNENELENTAGSICHDNPEISGHFIARIWADGPNPEADAAFIVEAVNNHDRLTREVAELMEMLRKLYNYRDFKLSQDAHELLIYRGFLNEVRDYLEKALAKVTP